MSANTSSVRWSMIVMWRSSGSITWTPTARIPTATSTPSCGTAPKRSASASVRSLPRPLTTARHWRRCKGHNRLAQDRKEEARHRRDGNCRMVQGAQAKTAQDRRGDAGAFHQAGQKLRPDVPLPALCGRTLCRRRICRLRAMGDAKTVFEPGGRGHLCRRTAKPGSEEKP